MSGIIDWHYCEEAVSNWHTSTMLYLHCKMFSSPYNKWLVRVICYVAQNIFLECTIFISQIYAIFRWSPQRRKTAVLVDSFKIVLPHDFMTPDSEVLMTVNDLSSPHSPPSPPCCYNSQQEIKVNKQSAFCGISGFRKSWWKVSGGKVWHIHRHYN